MLRNYPLKGIILNLLLFNSIYATNGRNNPMVEQLRSAHPQDNPTSLRLWLTISAEKRFLEISWDHAPARDSDRIMLTRQEPHSFDKLKLMPERLPQKPLDGDLGGNVNYSESTTVSPYIAQDVNHWISNDGENNIVLALKPMASSLWFTTGVYFDYELMANVTIHTSCYGYWASYVNAFGTILGSTCLRAYPTWMADMKAQIGNLRFRDLFLPGTHDSGSYRINFDPLLKETFVTKYALTQDEDIRSQLLHGIRYLDIRVGYYRNTGPLFYINHGITRQIPLIDVINQVKDFVEETNEIVIFGLKEFPVGFGRNLSIHHKLVDFLKDKFADLIVHPSATWRASLNDIWSRKQNVILAYDKSNVVHEYPHTLFGSVEQRWGNAQTWLELENFLRTINTYDVSRVSSRPIADMAELTPDTWGVIVNRYGGLRRMADRINWRVSQLYRDHLGDNANIVAVDFYRGTNLMDLAIDSNKRKLPF